MGTMRREELYKASTVLKVFDKAGIFFYKKKRKKKREDNIYNILIFIYRNLLLFLFKSRFPSIK